MQTLPHCRCWLSSKSCRQHSHSRGCSQLQAHPSRREAVEDVTSQNVQDERQQEGLLEQPAAPVDLDVEVSTAFCQFCRRILQSIATCLRAAFA